MEQEDGNESLVREMAERSRVRSPAPDFDPPVCLISWAGSDGFDRSDYEPATVCIGPYHRRKQSDAWESEKKDALHRMLPGGEDHQRRELELRRYLTAMGDQELRVRQCYGRPFDEIRTEEFKRMLLLDGCFLHTRLVPDSRTAQPPPVAKEIKVDRDIVFLIENQLPFFILEEIEKLITPASSVNNLDHVFDSVLGRLKDLVHLSKYSAPEVARPRSTHRCHLLCLLHMYFQPTILDVHTPSTDQTVPKTSFYGTVVSFVKHKVRGAPTATIGDPAPETRISVAQPARRWRSATSYHAAGVRFMPRKVGGGTGEARSILDVDLKGSTLLVPCLTVDNNTFRMLRNMVALEQQSSYRLSRSHVTTYCCFLSQLAGTEKDVELLVAKKIIVNLLQDGKEVAMGLSGLCDGTEINPDSSYLTAKQETLEKLCENGWRKSMAWLRHHKCNNYFMALAVLATIFVVLCTIEQSVLAALTYAKGRNG